jgi:ribose-phosphate pyrophosphokinase
VSDRHYDGRGHAGHAGDEGYVGNGMHEDSAMMVFSGNANLPLAGEITARLKLPLGKATVGRFSDGEVMVEINDSVRGKDVFIVQSTCTPVDQNLMELLVMIDAVDRASARRVTAVIPYFGYARQDRRPRSARVAISAKLVANMVSMAGADRVLTMDLHADQIQGFFSIPVDNIYASPVLLGDVWKHKYENLIVVSPDIGGVVRARALAKRLDDADLAIIDKRRPRANAAEVMNIIGDVSGRTCVIVDDMADTAGTLCSAAAALKKQGASRVVAYCTHPILSGRAVDNIEGSELDELVVSNTIPLDERAAACSRIRQLSIAELIAESIRRISHEESVGDLFMD